MIYNPPWISLLAADLIPSIKPPVRGESTPIYSMNEEPAQAAGHLLSNME
jgi:hypothetical protein